jgi:hypothetical protein
VIVDNRDDLTSLPLTTDGCGTCVDGQPRLDPIQVSPKARTRLHDDISADADRQGSQNRSIATGPGCCSPAISPTPKTSHVAPNSGVLSTSTRAVEGMSESVRDTSLRTLVGV